MYSFRIKSGPKICSIEIGPVVLEQWNIQKQLKTSKKGENIMEVHYVTKLNSELNFCSKSLILVSNFAKRILNYEFI